MNIKVGLYSKINIVHKKTCVIQFEMWMKDTGRFHLKLNCCKYSLSCKFSSLKILEKTSILPVKTLVKNYQTRNKQLDI